MKKKLLKRTPLSKLIAVVLATLILATALPLSVFAVPPPYSEGTLLLHMDSMSKDSVTFNPYSVMLSQTPGNKVVLGSEDTTQIVCSSSDVLGGIGLNTGLPLGSDTAYTIEFYAKMNPNNAMSFYAGFCQNLNYPMYGPDVLVYAAGNKVSTKSKWFVNGYYKEGTNNGDPVALNGNVWTDRAGEDGFVRFVLTFDGRYMGLSIGGEDIGVRYDLTRGNEALDTNGSGVKQSPKVNDWTVKTLCLQMGYSEKGAGSTYTKPVKDDVVVEIKDISIYSGVINPDEAPEPPEEPEYRQFVAFENEAGEELGYREIFDGSLTLEEIPELDITNVWYWYNKETGEKVEFPLTFTESTTLVAHQEFLTYEDGTGKVMATYEIPPVDGLPLETFHDVGLINVWDWSDKATGKKVQTPVTFAGSTTLVAHQEFVIFENAEGKALETYEIPKDDGLTFGTFPDLGFTNVWGWTNKGTGEDVLASTTFTETTILVVHQEFLTFENGSGKVMATYEIPKSGYTLTAFPDLGMVNLQGWRNKATGEEIQVPTTFTESTALTVRQTFDKNGPLLLRLSGLDKDAVTYQREGVNATQNYSYGVTKSNLSTYVVDKNGASKGWGGYGVLTDLPLTTDSVYTVEYYVKMNGNTGMYAGFTNDLKSPNKTAGVRVHMDGGVKNFYTGMDIYMRTDGSSEYGTGLKMGNPWKNGCDEDGYVRYVLTINKGVISLKVGDEVVPMSWHLENVKNTNAGVKLSDFDTKTLAFCVGFSSYGTLAKPANGTEIIDVKDISIYEGIVSNTDVMPQFQYVTFENENGGLLRKELLGEDGSVSIQNFPEAGAKMDALWLDKATGMVVLPPWEGDPALVITEPMTFVLYEKALNSSDVVDIQYSEAKDGTQSIRFIGGVYNTSCVGVGFDITARYKDADGKIVEMFYRLSGTTVYDSINATENGTMTNCLATDLGAFYIFGAVLDGVPTNIGQIDFEVKSFKMIGKLGLRIYGSPVTVSFKYGVINYALQPLA